MPATDGCRCFCGVFVYNRKTAVDVLKTVATWEHPTGPAGASVELPLPRVTIMKLVSPRYRKQLRGHKQWQALKEWRRCAIITVNRPFYCIMLSWNTCLGAVEWSCACFQEGSESARVWSVVSQRREIIPVELVIFLHSGHVMLRETKTGADLSSRCSCCTTEEEKAASLPQRQPWYTVVKRGRTRTCGVTEPESGFSPRGQTGLWTSYHISNVDGFSGGLA